MLNKTQIFIIVLLVVVCSLGWLQHSTQKDILNELKSAPVIRVAPSIDKTALNTEAQEMVNTIAVRYRIDQSLAEQIVLSAYKYQQPDFPTAKDVIAIIGIESSFNPKAVSKLKRDPAFGLTQIRPGVWSSVIDRSELNTIDGQVKHGTNILAHYYDIIGHKKGAIMSYNIGITAYRKGRTNQTYVDKFRAERAHYKS